MLAPVFSVAVSPPDCAATFTSSPQADTTATKASNVVNKVFLIFRKVKEVKVYMRVKELFSFSAPRERRYAPWSFVTLLPCYFVTLSHRSCHEPAHIAEEDGSEYGTLPTGNGELCVGEEPKQKH